MDKWNEIKFGDLFSYIPNNTFSRADLNYELGEYKNVHYGDVLIKFGPILDAGSEALPYITGCDDCKKESLLMDGDVIIADTAEDETVGKATEIVNIGHQKIVSGLHTIACRPLIRMAPTYLGFYINTENYHKQLFALMQGIKVLSISKSNIEGTIIRYPHLCEQTKICSLLNLLENRIAKQRELIEHLKKYKRGVLRTAFCPQQTSTWKEYKLKEVTDIYDGTHQTPEYKDQGVKFVSVENIEDLSKTQKYISVAAFQKDFKVHPELGDVLMTRIGDIGRAAYIDFDDTIAFYVSLALFKCGELVNGEYLKHYIGTDHFQKELWERTLHIAFPKKINTGEIGECPILLPEMDQQIRIASMCSAIDKKICSTEEMLSLLQKMKFGLSQQLFI